MSKSLASPPGNTIKELMEDQNICYVDFCSKMGCTTEELQGLLDGSKRIDAFWAVHLEEVLGPPKIFWLNLERIYRERLLNQ